VLLAVAESIATAGSGDARALYEEALAELEILARSDPRLDAALAGEVEPLLARCRDALGR
jgi:hypothetical protein